MISQKCPKCRSSRVRKGYRPTSIFLKLLFRYHLLCDNCNWEFVGFAVPGTVDSKPKRRKKKLKTNNVSEVLSDQVELEENDTGKQIARKRIKKKVKIRF